MKRARRRRLLHDATALPGFGGDGVKRAASLLASFFCSAYSMLETSYRMWSSRHEGLPMMMRATAPADSMR